MKFLNTCGLHPKKVLLFFICLSFVFYGGLGITVYTLNTDKLQAGQSLKIVLLTDLHSHIYRPQQKPLIQKIMAQDPDLILLSGDFLDDEAGDDGGQLLLAGIKAIAPIYYVTGNHEWWSGKINAKLKILQDYGVHILQGDSVVVEIKGIPIRLVGVDDPAISGYDFYGTTMTDQLSKLPSTGNREVFSILLAHRPEAISDYLAYDYDLIVSGHAHGGQVRIPYLLKGLYAPNQGFFPKYTSGMTTYGRSNHVISRGLSYNYRLPRVMNPPEIVLIQLESSSLSVEAQGH